MTAIKYLDKILLLLILGFYLLLTLPLINDEPPVFPDETFFANFAYNLTRKEPLVPVVPFQTRLNPIDQKSGPTFYGPMFFFALAIPLKIFGFSLLAVKLTPIFIGILCLIASYHLGKGLFLPLLLATNPLFLEATRTARPEILTIFWILLSSFFYVKNRYITAGLFASFAFLTQMYLGIIPIISILFHLIFRKTKKGFIFLLPIICLAFLWWTYLLTQKDSFTTFLPFISTRITPSFYSLKSILLANNITKLFLLINLSTVILLIFKKSSSFWVINFIITAIVVIYGSASWYLSLIVIPTYLALLHLKEQRLIFAVLFSIFIFVNLYYQLFLISHYQTNNYESFSQKLSSAIPQNSKVILGNITPDPYFYLVKNRPDLKIFWPPLLDHPESYQPYFQKADILVITMTDYVHIKDLSYFTSSFFRKSLFNFLQDKDQKVDIIPEQRYGGAAVIKL